MRSVEPEEDKDYSSIPAVVSEDPPVDTFDFVRL